MAHRPQEKKINIPQKRRSTSYKSAAQNTRNLLPLVFVCAIFLAGVMAFGNPILWMTQEQAGAVSGPTPDPQPEPTPTALDSDEDILLSKLDAGAGLISEYRSISQSENEDRAHNIVLAADAVNGYVIKAGGTFSFNQVVGNTGTDERYREAPIIAGNDVDFAHGGGICQVSTTLYVAALEADMEIVERHPHTVVTDYVPIGLDATIDYETLDLRIKNTTDHPIGILVEAIGQEVIVKLYGEPLAEGVIVDASSRIVTQGYDDETGEGTYVVESHRNYYHNGVLERDEYLYKDTYYISAAVQALLGGNGTDPTK